MEIIKFEGVCLPGFHKVFTAHKRFSYANKSPRTCQPDPINIEQFCIQKSYLVSKEKEKLCEGFGFPPLTPLLNQYNII
ncbi:hypothetical protein Leryth_001461 [Lithospermum erythrorhizon]|nr:hypothetical protein Leryth_001461 [Lithospermum erythrorhizon]